MTDLFQSLSNIPWVLMRLRKSRLNSWWRRLWVPKHPSMKNYKSIRMLTGWKLW